jgi:hypothetical protein
MTYQERAQILLKKIINTFNLKNEERQIMRLFNVTTRECLSYPVTEGLPPFSWICADGTPLQFSVSLERTSRSRHMLRYVTEICKPTMSLPERMKLTRKRVPQLLEIINAPNLQPKIDELLDSLLPTSSLSPEYSMFGVWIGVQHKADEGTALKFYCNLLWQIGNPWSMFFSALKILDEKNEKMNKIRKLLGDSCHPNSMGIECSANGIGRLKLYLRGYELSLSHARGLLRELNLLEFEGDLMSFHNVFLEKMESYHPFSTVLCVGVPRDEDESHDLKFEIGPKFYLADDEGALSLVTRLAHKLELDVTSYERIIDLFSGGVFSKGVMRYHDIIGIGFDSQNGARLTTYLRPNLIAEQNDAA